MHLSSTLRFIVLLFTALRCAAPGPSASAASEVNRVVVQSVRLLRPTGAGLVASEPIDVLIEDGLVAEVGQELISQLEPGQMALRGRDLWLVPAPRLRIPGDALVASDLVVAGLLGVGTVGVDSDGVDYQPHLIRAGLEEAGLPLLEQLRSDEEADGRFELRAQSISKAALPSQPAEVAHLLRSIDRRNSDPFLPGSPARFLVLESDPRAEPSTLADPFAVLQGSHLILKSERVVLLEEYAAFLALKAPTAEELGWPGGSANRRLYTLVIRGLPRGYVLAASWKAPDGSMVVRVAERIAAPLEESFEATVRWPDGTVDCSWTVQSRSFAMRSDPASGHSGKLLHIALNGAPIPQTPVALKSGDQFLPHSLLIAYDALLDPSGGTTSRLVEVDVMSAPVRVEWSDRVPVKRVPEALPGSPLTPDQIRALGRSSDGQLLLRSEGPTAAGSWASQFPPGQLLLTDDQPWPVLMILSTPWGIVEWVSASDSGSVSADLPDFSQ